MPSRATSRRIERTDAAVLGWIEETSQRIDADIGHGKGDQARFLVTLSAVLGAIAACEAYVLPFGSLGTAAGLVVLAVGLQLSWAAKERLEKAEERDARLPRHAPPRLRRRHPPGAAGRLIRLGVLVPVLVMAVASLAEGRFPWAAFVFLQLPLLAVVEWLSLGIMAGERGGDVR